MLGAGLADEERAFEPDVHGRVPGRFGQRLEFARHDLHGVVDENIDAPALVDDGIDHPGDIGGLGDVANDTKTTNVLGGRRGGRRIDVVDDDLGALAGIGERDVAADAAPRPGDQRHFVLQPHGILP